MPEDASRTRPELRPVGDDPSPLSRVPWTTLAEIGGGLCAVALVSAALASAARLPGEAGAAIAIELCTALAVLVPLLLRHPIALARALRRERAEAERARRDHLTGLANRLAMDAALDALIERGAALTERAGRGGSTRGVVRYWAGAAYLLVDLDHFKPVNDGAGHAAGDRLLVEIAALLRSLCGPHDLPARVGGDEFAILMERRGAVEARELAAAVRDALAHHAFVVDGRRYPVSGSLGLARIAASDADAEAIRAAADRGAYAAKAHGRDSVYEIAALGDEPSLVERVATDPATGGPAGSPDPAVIARRALGLEAPDRVELAADPAGEPPVPGRASRHVTALADAAARLAPEVPVSVVMPALLGEEDLGTLSRAVRDLAARRGRRAATTVLLEMPRRRGERAAMDETVALVRGAGLPVGIVCRAHTLDGLAELAGLDPDELQLHLGRAPDGTLAAYRALARAGAGWTLGVSDVDDPEAIPALARAGVERLSGAAIGAPGPPEEVRASLGRPLGRAPETPPTALGRAA